MYVSAGVIWLSLPEARSTSARRCSKKASLISPVSGVSATSGPEARVAFSVKRRVMVLPSGDQPGVQGIRDAGADASWRSGGLEIFHVNHRAARDHAVFGMNVFHPGDGIAVRGNGGLLKGMRGEKCPQNVVKRRGRLRFLRAFDALLDILLGDGFFLRQGMA